MLGFRCQVGKENGAKIDPKRHQKNDAKKKSTKMAKKSVQDAAPPRGRRVQGAGEEVGGGVNPSSKEGGKGIEAV